MAYFLKKTKNKKGLYLQIYESFYDPERGHTAREKRIVTYNPKLAKKQIYEINKEVEKAHLFTITGHFLICYLSVLLTRLFQFKILKNRYSSEDLFEGLGLLKYPRRNISILQSLLLSSKNFQLV